MFDRFLRRISLGGRLFGIFFIISVLLILRLVLSAQSNNRLIDQLRQTNEVENHAIRLLLQASRQITSSRLYLLQFIQDYTPSPYQALDDAALAAQSIQSAINLLPPESEQVETLSPLLVSVAEYNQLINDIESARKNGETQNATRFEFQASRLGNDLSARLEQEVNAGEQRVATASEQAFASAQRDFLLTSLSGALILVGALLLIGLVALSITRPIAALRAGAEAFRATRTAVHIEDRGADEVTTLAQTFNLLTSELSQSYAELEKRVAERTQALERRALQLRTTAEVAREATTATADLDVLLSRSANLIRDRFSFYHVSIFLLDDQRKFAVLRAATGEAGRAMLLRNFKMKVGEMGIVGYVTGSGAPRVVNDVNTDFVYLKHPLLPETRSELALPLTASGQIIGALDVQSTQVNAFTDEDIAILQILADQLAVAIQNAKLLAELQNSLKEASTLYQRFTQEAWLHTTHSQRTGGYEYDLSELAETRRAIDPGLVTQLQLGKPVEQKQTAPESGQERTTLLSPLMMYGQMIGVVGLEEDNPHHHWTPEEIALVEAVANQVALALDNARLLEETQIRSEQLRLLQEITAAAASHVKLEPLLNEVTEKLKTGFNLAHCALSLYGPTSQSVTAATEPYSETSGELFADERPEDTIRRTHKPLAIYNVQRDARASVLHERLAQYNAASYLIAPLVLRGELIGALELLTADPNRRFDEEDLRLLEQISLQTAAAIDVARSFEETVRRAEREQKLGAITSNIRQTLDMEAILKTAVREVQHSLGLPEVVIRLGGPTLGGPTSDSLNLEPAQGSYSRPGSAVPQETAGNGRGKSPRENPPPSNLDAHEG